MVKSFLAKKKSKRMTCRRKHKIEKKIREHNRKTRKEQKSAAKSGHKRKQEIQVPNKCPFKDEVLREAQEKRKLEEEAKEKRRLELKEKRKEAKTKLTNEKRGLEGLVESAQERQKSFQSKDDDVADQSFKETSAAIQMSKAADNSLKSYYAEVKKVIERADVVVQVLDARDPLGSRSSELEKSIVESGKRLVLLLNKIDLIPKENVLSWLKYLRNEFPAVAFKASTQSQNSNLGRAGHSIVNTSKCIGADLLMKLLGNYCRNKDIKTSICVGIVGYPNVGKSSIINSLKRKTACNTGAMPGITKTLQEVHLDKKIRLIDTPGVALCSKDSYDRVEMALRNVIRVDLLEDPIAPVEAILRRCTKDSLILQYKISDFDDIDDFLCQVAKKIGRVKKGGIPDKRMAAKRLLHDWNSGKIRYYTLPPETSTGVQLVSSELVTTMSKEFDLGALENDDKLIVEDLSDLAQPDAIVLPAWKDVVKIDSKQSTSMDVDEGKSSLTGDRVRGILKKSIAETESTLEDKLEGNQRLNKNLKDKLKKQKKTRKRADKLSTKLSDAFDSAMEIGGKDEKYDFDEHFN